jgi:ornithine carbamoyltransferase
MLGATVRVASPKGYELQDSARQAIAHRAGFGGSLHVSNDPVQAVQGADAVYTDVWTSMGQESETEDRLAIFAPFRVDAELMAQAADGALFMHCLPAHRGDEVTDDVIDSDASVVFDQSENRLHAQKALLAMLA